MLTMNLHHTTELHQFGKRIVYIYKICVSTILLRSPFDQLFINGAHKLAVASIMMEILDETHVLPP